MECHLFEDVLMDLKIIAMVQPYQKISVVDNRFALESFYGNSTNENVNDANNDFCVVSVEHSSSTWYKFTNGVFRMFSGQKRKHVLHKLRQRVTELENYLRNDLVKENWIKQELKDLHLPVIRGLKNLQTTYKSDSQTYVHLDVIATRMESIFKDFHKLQSRTKT